MESDEEPKRGGMSPERRKLIEKIRADIKAQNLKLREERSARRWKAERGPEEYMRQKAQKRELYAEGKERAEHLADQPVRSYEKIVGKGATDSDKRADHVAQAKARDAEYQRERYAALSPEKKQAKIDAKDDRRFVERCRKKNMPEDEIEAAQAIRRNERNTKRAAEKAAYEANMASIRANSIM